MNETTFFRLLKEPVDEKSITLTTQVTALRNGVASPESYSVNLQEFTVISGSVFAYWVSQALLNMFQDFILFDTPERTAKRGPSSGDDFRRIRAWWEVPASLLGRPRRWVPFAKGGAHSQYYADTHLVVDWDEHRFTFRDFFGRPGREIPKLESSSYFFRPGLTWPARTNGFSVRVLPSGSIFSHKGPAAFIKADSPTDLLFLLAIMNSVAFGVLVQVQLARTELAQSYEVGLIQNTPVPEDSNVNLHVRLTQLARQAYELQRELDQFEETSHVLSDSSGCLKSAVYASGWNSDAGHRFGAKSRSSPSCSAAN